MRSCCGEIVQSIGKADCAKDGDALLCRIDVTTQGGVAMDAGKTKSRTITARLSKAGNGWIAELKSI
jgi:hypothetical protein